MTKWVNGNLSITLAALVLSVFYSSPAAAEGLKLSDLWDLEGVSNPQVSPDGAHIIFSRQGTDMLQDIRTSALWIMNADGSKKRFLVEGAGARWSLNGERIAFISTDGNDAQQIFTRWMDDEGAVSQISKLASSPKDITWSPDGKWIAFRMLVPASVGWQIDMPQAPANAKWTDAPVIIDHLHYRQDRKGFNKPGFDHLFVIPVDGGTPRQITNGNWHVGAHINGLDIGTGLSWTEDSRQIVFAGLTEENADVTFGETYLYSADIVTAKISKISKEKGIWLQPRVSPNGKLIAYSGFDFEYTKQTYKSRELWISNVDGSDRRMVSGDLDGDVAQLHWANDSNGVFFTVGKRGYRQLYYASRNGTFRKLTDGKQLLSVTSLDAKGNAVGVTKSPERPEEIVRFSLRSPKRASLLTDINSDLLSNRQLGAIKEIMFTSPDGTELQGWMIYPPGFDPSKKYALILMIHGGPHGMYDGTFNASFQVLAARGYVVLYTNPRGSTGYGTDFGNAIFNAFPGKKDFEDLMAGVDFAVADGSVDDRRLFVAGCSGGGILTTWAVSHTNRFTAAVSLCPVANWLSFAGTTDIVGWGMRRFRPFFWEDPTPWLEHSPIMHVASIKTPTLIMTGVLDLRTPMSQSEELYSALKILGVPTRLVRFNKEWHTLGSTPTNQVRQFLYILDWFKQWDPTLKSNNTGEP